MFKKMFACAAIAMGSLVVGAAPAGADPNPSSAGPNPFAGLTCSCQSPHPARVPDVAEFNRGINAALSHD